MGRRSTHRRLRATALLAAVLLAGCSAPGAVTDSLHTRLNAALSDHERDAFLAFFPGDTQGQARGMSWYTALAAGSGELSRAGASGLTVSTRFPGDRRTATQSLTYQGQGEPPVISAVTRTPGTPLWALEATDVTAATAGTLLSAGLDSAARSQWSRRMDRAVTTVAAADLPGADAWPGGIVVEVPSGDADFRLVTDSAATDASAITICEGGTPRIVVSPEALGLGQEWLDSTLVHEAVHVATDSACVDPGGALGWAVEGLAESVTARADPATASRNRKLVAGYLTASGVPDALPDRLDTLTDYALAQVAVDRVRAHLGDRADDLLDRAIHDASSVTSAELHAATSWYVAELRRRAQLSR